MLRRSLVMASFMLLRRVRRERNLAKKVIFLLDGLLLRRYESR